MELENIENLNNAVKEHEERLKKIEEFVFGSKQTIVQAKKRYKGLVGGIIQLIDSGFLNQPKSVDEISKELVREGYYHSKDSLDKLLRIDFMNIKKILTRIREDNIWKYVLRK